MSDNKTRRYKSIDLFRGIVVFFMIAGHMLLWWLTPDDVWFYYIIIYAYLGPVASGGFLFISGVSTQLAYKKSLIQMDESDVFNKRMARNSYIFRALLLLLISFPYNIAIALAINNLAWIWSWFVLQTMGFSLLMAWPLLKTSKTFRIIIGIIILIANFMLLELLQPFQGQENVYGVLFHVLFNPLDLCPIGPYFVFFLFGTVIGDFLYDINIIDDPVKRLKVIKNKFIFPNLLIGSVLLISGILILFPSFLGYYTFSAILYSIGFWLVALSIFLGIEEFKLIKVKKSYRFFFFQSYYSFTIFLTHDPLYFLFNQQLTVFSVWIAIIISFILLTLLLRFMHEKFGPRLSLKYGLGLVSLLLTIKLEQRRYIKNGNLERVSDLRNLLKSKNK